MPMPDNFQFSIFNFYLRKSAIFAFLNRMNRLSIAGKYFYKKIKYLIIRLISFSKTITLPGLQGLSLYHVGGLFFEGLKKGYITERAAAVAFNFLTALFPLLLFAFTIIPYIPSANFQTDLLDLLKNIIPTEVWNVIDPTVTYIVKQRKGNLLSLGFLLSLYFATNGINSLLTAFTHSFHNFDRYNSFKIRLHSLFILLIVGLMLIVLVGLVALGGNLLNFIATQSTTISHIFYYGLYVLRLGIELLMALLIISFLYKMAITDRKAFTFFSVGAKVAAFLIVATSVGFSFYIKNWTHYNLLYGSLGTILILTMYIYLNAIFLLIGFDINASIYAAKKKFAQQSAPQISENK